MKTDNDTSGTWSGGWLVAALAGLIAAVLARLIGELAMTPAILIGLLVFLVFGVLLGSGGVEQTDVSDHGAADDHGHDHDGHDHDGHDHDGHDHAHGHAAVTPISTPPAAPVAPVAPPIPPAPAAAMAPAAPASPPLPSSAGAASKPKGLAAARGGKADDLKAIEGIGPAMEKLCNELGFFHFDQISNWSLQEIAWVDENLKGFKGRVTRDKWVAQAKLIGAVGIEEFRRRAKTNDY